jgi:hypothetical protein
MTEAAKQLTAKYCPEGNDPEVSRYMNPIGNEVAKAA